ncbi:nuclear transport factor 2 family protein [Mucilaginibacter sp. Bleaf8]|uniref:nuclear transport factor 2 family protein n=1 Tax=Mucilaginibacter sp. Bleaf8 TaxID=2834430 RepID=UPI001BCD2118|nr:nuclear transport factor 2 family protein [Mucilaginibacter sp. Bleaf8]MBS7567097.1 nuclear transport factor 2 family protein [Mucilaginibacter sp. Bleaf8]
MKKLLISLIIITGTVTAFAQPNSQDAVKQAVNDLFTAMRKGDTVMLKTVFHPNMVLQSTVAKADGSTVLITEKPADFIKAIGTPHKEVYDERIVIKDVKIDGPLASVWATYKFYAGSTFSHCGVDVFQLMKTAAGWKIIYIADTRRKDNCPE